MIESVRDLTQDYENRHKKLSLPPEVIHNANTLLLIQITLALLFRYLT